MRFTHCTSVHAGALALLLALVIPSVVFAAEAAPWKVVTEKPGLTIYERLRDGSELREFKAVGTIPAAPVAVRRVLDDVDSYPAFMPYMAEAKVLSRDANQRVSYQRISPPLVGDRDYTIRVRTEQRKTAEGITFFNRWETANDLGPAEKKGVTRVKVTEGSWLLEPTDGGKQTRATYSVFSDSGGKIPVSIMNMASRTAIPKLFDAVRKQVQSPKYSEAQ